MNCGLAGFELASVQISGVWVANNVSNQTKIFNH